jgi:mRNA-degrading endonuclease RelE of RelBE toxin-antitoxin system
MAKLTDEEFNKALDELTDNYTEKINEQIKRSQERMEAFNSGKLDKKAVSQELKEDAKLRRELKEQFKSDLAALNKRG